MTVTRILKQGPARAQVSGRGNCTPRLSQNPAVRLHVGPRATNRRKDLMISNDLLGELQVLEMGESQINGATTVEYRYVAKNVDNSAGEGRNVENSATLTTSPAAR